MKVILLQDVAKIGKRSALVEVPDGYALNQLIPKGMAEPATAANQKRIERMQAAAAATDSAEQDKFAAAAQALSEKGLEIAMEVNEQGHAFQAVHQADIVIAAEAAGVTIDEAMVVIDQPIKELGEHTVSLVRGDSKADITINVIKK